MTKWRQPSFEVWIVAVIFASSFATSFVAMKMFRSEGIQPGFYQENFEPAVMMACDRGFVTAAMGTLPAQLTDFLQLRRNDFDCGLLSESLPRGPVTWNATWYYLYGATAAVWKVAGISWTALDGLVALFGAVVSVALYGLFRLVTVPWAAAAATLLLLISPANLTKLLSLRDYSKAPFVLTAVLILGVLVTKTLRTRAVLGFAVAYGAVVGIGYGFRSDLAVMVPFGGFVIFALLPGAFRQHLWRNMAAFAVLIGTFVVAAWPALRGLGQQGGCQFHYALLGLTTPLTNELGMSPSLYQFGGHFLDTFVDLKVGDYGNRVLGMPVPLLCSADYDVASGGLFRELATTFPADLVAHAYGSVLMVLRAGLAIPAMMQPAPPFPSLALPSYAYLLMNRVTQDLAPIGLVLTLVAIGFAWMRSARLGITLTIFVLFLSGYPAIEFEERHWFHLRFIPWWAGLLVAGHLVQRGQVSWNRAAIVRGLVGTLGLVVAMGAALAAFRAVQTERASALVERYLSARTETVAIQPDGATVRVQWTPIDYAGKPAHRASDLLVVTLDAARCTGNGPLTVRAQYEADAPSHDISTNMTVARPLAGAAATRLFVPVFWQGFVDHDYLRFSRFELTGAPATCVADVSRVVEGANLPLWVEMQVPANWTERPLYQSIRTPRALRSLFGAASQ